MKNQKGFTLVELMVVLLVIAVLALPVVGWVKNIIKLSECDFEAPYRAEVIHAIGIIPPVGMITGWLDLGK